MNNFNNISKDIVLHNLIRLNQLVFEVTDACNLHCKYCAYADLYGGYDQRRRIGRKGGVYFSRARRKRQLRNGNPIDRDARQTASNHKGNERNR